MTPANLAAMQAAKAEVEEYSDAALSAIAEAPSERATPAQVDQAHAIAMSYVQLVGAALERFEEVVRGR